MGRYVRVLCQEESKVDKEGVRWLVGSCSMPFTVLSILHCLHFNNSGDPDYAAEAGDLRILLPKGLGVIGALLVDDLGGRQTAKRASNYAYNMVSCISPDSDKSSGVIAALSGVSGFQYFLCMPQEDFKLEVPDEIIYEENAAEYFWKNMCFMRCQICLKVPIYAPSFDKPADYEKQLSRAVENIMADFESPRLCCLVEHSSGHFKRTLPIMIQTMASKQRGDALVTQVVDDGQKGNADGSFLCSEFFSCISTTLDSQLPVPLKLTLMLNQSMNGGKVSAPKLEYLPAYGNESIRIVQLELDVLCLGGYHLHLAEAVASLVIPALNDQLISMKGILKQIMAEKPKLCAYHFCPPGLLHPVSSIYDLSYGELELGLEDIRRKLHRRLGLPMDRPLLRIANALTFAGTENITHGHSTGGLRLRNVHSNLPRSGVNGGRTSTIDGSYEYYHYLQENFDDKGWGCAYRSLQTIMSWFKLQHYTSNDVPTHRRIQEILVEIGDKEPSFIGSQEWIGAIELSFVLDKLLGVTSKILNVRSGAELPDKCRELAFHFEMQGTPIMIGGGVLAYTLLGVDYNDSTGESAFLILDPHYTGAEDLKSILNGGWCGWKRAVSAKGEEFFLRNKFYNLLLPQRPNTV